MISEYALQPEAVATWYKSLKHIFIRDFGSEQGRFVSRYPKKWPKMVWEAFGESSEMEKKRMEEILSRLKEAMIKRTGYFWDEQATWSENVLQEHARYPFRAILTLENPEKRPGILCEDDLMLADCPGWESPHGCIVERRAQIMADAVRSMLACCRWVKFIDPHLSPDRRDYKLSLEGFLNLLVAQRPVDPPKTIEIHIKLNDATSDFLINSFQRIIPKGLQTTLYQWKERQNGQKLHNRYILTDLGGVSFQHGLDAGNDGETDDITRLTLDQYKLRCKQYSPNDSAFDEAEKPIEIIGIRNR